MFFTRPDHLMQALTDSGLPHQLGYVVVTTMQLIPRFQSKAQKIISAQQSRGLETGGSLLHRARMLLPLVAPLILGSIIDIEERAIALEARAFAREGERTSLYSLHDSRAQTTLRYGLLAFMLILPVLRVWYEAAR
jgi:energy-coupling factor transport system permease protein